MSEVNERSRLDEAVEVAWMAFDGDMAYFDENVAPQMRAAILAALPILLGEPVAWRWRHPNVNEGEWILANEPPSEEHRLVGWTSEPMYAPSLGEGGYE